MYAIGKTNSSTANTIYPVTWPEKVRRRSNFSSQLYSSTSSLSFSLTVCISDCCCWHFEFMLRYFVCWTQSFLFCRKFITITPQFSAKVYRMCLDEGRSWNKTCQRSKSSIYSPTHIRTWLALQCETWMGRNEAKQKVFSIFSITGLIK